MTPPRPHHARSAMLLALVLVAGCGGPSARKLPLDKSLARASLEKCLTAWKAGESMQSLATQQPPIICTDDDWRQGAKLLDYKLLDPESDDGTNLHCRVELTLQHSSGVPVTRQANYVIGTSPSITIGRF